MGINVRNRKNDKIDFSERSDIFTNDNNEFISTNFFELCSASSESDEEI
jgi:hypothetical protein